MDEAADYLRWTRRGLIKVAKRHGLCMVRGREVTFTKADIVGIIEALRPKPSGILVGRLTTPAVRYALPGSRLYELAVKPKLERQARKEAQRERFAKAREEQRELAAESKRQEAAQKRAAKAAQQPSAPEPLDYTNRDSNYWTAARKRQLRAERNGGGE
ncbi:hypothetical protein [Mesorhizobium sp.]|uniref:hypothetical protein n=1 Tax=Mesorhizobium sp. TaxID=1871066 RepID=UPI000FE61E5B|nr:hypothetical protein [Mesorhizobium sp.]RWB68370.1 MAG: hypothetical protein EOQ49_22710 [Mesorhizobium sp.]